MPTSINYVENKTKIENETSDNDDDDDGYY